MSNNYLLLAHKFHKLGLLDQAVVNYKIALELNKNSFDANHLLGAALLQLNDPLQAIEFFMNAEKIDNMSAALFSNLGVAYYKLKDNKKANYYLLKSIELDQNYSPAYYNIANNFASINQEDLAMKYYDHCISLNPDYAEAFNARGLLHIRKNNFFEAMNDLNKSIKINPKLSVAYNNIGVCHSKMGNTVQAINYFLTSAKHNNNEIAETYCNVANEFKKIHLFNSALIYYNKSIGIDSNNHNTILFKSLLLLLLGRYTEGFDLFESRLLCNIKISNDYSHKIPKWTGKENLNGKTLYITPEQGLGDFIQFFRFVLQLKNKNISIVLATPKALQKLFNIYEDENLKIVNVNEIPFDADYICPLLSLPHFLGTNLYNIPYKEGYIKANPDKRLKWSEQVKGKKKIRIGLVWSSDSDFQDDIFRSIPFSTFLKGLPIDDNLDYICLQKILLRQDINEFYYYKHVKFIGDEIDDFSDTAGICSTLDLVISTCTSVPHLSAAMSIPTWLLLSANADWRWLLNREDSPWYSSIKIFRQLHLNDWAHVLDSINIEILSFIRKSENVSDLPP